MTIQDHVHSQLQKCKIFHKTDNSVDSLTILGQLDKNRQSNKIELEKIFLKNIPKQNLWIYENEKVDAGDEKNKYAAFTSAGSKVERTLIFQNDKKLFIILIEFKTQITPEKFREKVVPKFEQSLDTISPYIAAHPEICIHKISDLIVVGLCCYNNFEDPRPTNNNNGDRVDQKVRDCVNKTKTINQLIEPFIFNRTNIRVIFCNNPYPQTTSFDIDFQDFFKKAFVK